MIFDVLKILKTDGARVPVCGLLTPPEGIFLGELSFTDKVSFTGTLQNIGGVLELSGEATGAFTVPCARCMKETKQHFSVMVKETFANEFAEVTDREAVIPFSGTQIDLGEAIWPEIFLSIDSKYICREDCKGLCPMCGVDLNHTTCQCKEDEIDPRLAGLKDLLK